jgi:hypothetical protein
MSFGSIRLIRAIRDEKMFPSQTCLLYTGFGYIHNETIYPRRDEKVRRMIAGVMAALCLAGMAPVAAIADTTVTAQEWRWMEAAVAREKAGDLAGAAEVWKQLVPSLRTHNFEACGNYAKKLGHFYDDRAMAAEALTYFDIQIECWGKLTADPAFVEGLVPETHRAEQLRPVIDTYVSRPAAEAPKAPLAKHEPALGTLLGGTVDQDTAIYSDLSKVKQVYGKPYAMTLIYTQWGQYPQDVAFKAVLDGSPSLQVAWEPSWGLEAVQDTPYVRNFARQLKELNRPVFLRYASEMNGRWSAWYGDPALYKEKWRLVTRIMREEAPNVAMVWSPSYVGDAPVGDYYPGDEWVDWVGINAYTDPYPIGNPALGRLHADILNQGKQANPLDKLREIYGAYAARKPIMLAETGFGWANRTPEIDESAWAAESLERFYGYLPLVFPRLKAVAYFNVDFTIKPNVPGHSHYVLSGNARLTEAYRQATAGDWYLSDPAASVPAFWRPMNLGTLTGPTQMASYVNLPYGVGRVEYLLDGQLKATARRIPWVADLDLSGLTGSHTITVRAYDKQGRLGHERSYPFDASAIKVMLNGRYLDFDQPPVMVDGRTLVPARAILEALGAQLSWDGATQTVAAVKDGQVLKLQIGNRVPLRDGRPLPALDVPASLIGGRTLVPARFVSENYNMDVQWDNATQTVVITSK